MIQSGGLMLVKSIKLLKKVFALVLMTGLFHDPERGFDASKIHKTFEKSFWIFLYLKI
jgi:hypothetical protein